MKKLVASIGAASMVFAFAGIASASTVTDSSSLTSSTVLSLMNSMRNRNNFSGDVTATSSSTTGGVFVSSSDDQDGTQITTGSADAAVGTETSANNIDTDVIIDVDGSVIADPGTDVDDESTASYSYHEVIENETDNVNDSTNSEYAAAGATSGNVAVNSGDSLTGTRVTTGGGITTVLSSGAFNNLVERFEIRRR